jgi:Ca2+/Na+ antiporter
MPKPSVIHGLQEVIENVDGSFSCFLWQQSAFYSKARIGLNAWQLKWFTFRSEMVTSVPDRSYMARFSTYPPFQHIEIDESHLMLQCHPVNSERRNCILMAPSPDVLRRVVESLNQQPRNSEDIEDDHSVSIAEADNMKEQRGPSLVSFPFGASPAYQLLHIFLFPLKALMHWTVPDPRFVSADQLEPKLRRAVMGIIMCIVWLIVGSFAMVTSLEHLGALMRIPSSVIGITISAAGTSLPNYVASVMAARQGLGNQAVSNAFGSNSFNILMGLGLPWAMYTTFYGTYSNLQDDEITTSVVFLAAVLVAFLVLITLSGFVLYRWHAYLFVSVYILYVTYAIGQVYV